MPALINYHDHLELNHYPRTRPQPVYSNAHQWAEDVNARLNQEPFSTLRAHSFADKAFIGGLKNLLSGVTTIFQHGDPKRELFAKGFPVRVVRRYGWAHSLHFTSASILQKTYQQTPKKTPFFIHLAEGTDDTAKSEYQRLKALGCVGANTVLVHGVGIGEEDITDALTAQCWLVTCPTTNHYLLGATANTACWNGRVLLGSDSRLTAEGNLLDEIAFAKTHNMIHQAIGFNWLYPLIKDDFIIAETLLKRTDIQLIVKDGVAIFGTPALMNRARVPSVACTLDGQERKMHVTLARLAHRVKLKEDGFMLDEISKSQLWWFSR